MKAVPITLQPHTYCRSYGTEQADYGDVMLPAAGQLRYQRALEMVNPA